MPSGTGQNLCDMAPLQVFQRGVGIALRLPVTGAAVPVRAPTGKLDRQVGQGQRIALGHDHRLHQRIFQLADITRPVMGDQRVHDLGRDPADTLADLPVDALEKMLGQRPDVVAAIAQGRQADIDDMQAVIQILAEFPRLDPCRQIGIGRGDEAGVAAHRLAAAHGAVFALFQQTQQFALQTRR